MGLNLNIYCCHYFMSLFQRPIFLTSALRGECDAFFKPGYG